MPLLRAQRDVALAANDAFGVGPRLTAGVDRAEHEAISAVVDDRRAERHAATHVTERVVAHHGNVLQALLDAPANQRQRLLQRGDASAFDPQGPGLPSEDLGHVSLPRAP